MKKKVYSAPYIRTYGVRNIRIVTTSIPLGWDADVDNPAWAKPRETQESPSRDEDWRNYTGQ